MLLALLDRIEHVFEPILDRMGKSHISSRPLTRPAYVP